MGNFPNSFKVLFNQVCCQNIDATENQLHQFRCNNVQSQLQQKLKQLYNNKIGLQKSSSFSKDALTLLRIGLSHQTMLQNILSDTKRSSKLKSSNNLLTLQFLKSPAIPPGTLIQITPRGIQGCQRKDGIVYFGQKKKLDGKIINDFVIPPTEEQRAQRGREFMVYFDTLQQQYYLQDLGMGPGVYVKLESEHLIKTNQMINIGESFIIFYIESSNQYRDRLTLKIYARNSPGRTKHIYPIEFYSSFLTVGRNSSCDIVIEDKLLSKVQVSIVYSASQWILIDGNAGLRIRSTNGTWLFASERVLLGDSTEFKTNQSLLRASVDGNNLQLNSL